MDMHAPFLIIMMKKKIKLSDKPQVFNDDDIIKTRLTATIYTGLALAYTEWTLSKHGEIHDQILSGHKANPGSAFGICFDVKLCLVGNVLY